VIEPLAVQSGGGVDGGASLFGGRAGDLVTGCGRRQILENERVRLGGAVQTFRQTNAGDPVGYLGVEAMLALPHPHHLSDHLAARVGGGQLHDDR
jgi:hypothetical protein